MLSATRVRLYPTEPQKGVIVTQFGCARWTWNEALALTQRVYRETGKGLTFVKLCARLPELKSANGWLADCDSQVLQASLRHLAAAFQNFFEKRGGYPRFKSKRDRQSIQYPQRVKLDGNHIRLPKVGLVKCVVHRPIRGTIKTVTVSRNACGHYYASILTQDDLPMPTVSTDGKVLGVDVGLLDLAVTSDGSKYENPRHLRKAEKNLKRKQHSLSRKKKGSSNRNKARKIVARVHERVSNARNDFLHKLSRRLVNENQVIAVEDLNVKGMTKNPNLAKAIHDVGWGAFAKMLEYKCEHDGKALVKVGRFFPSSKTCSDCGFVRNAMPLDVRTWTCVNCGSLHDRDVNAARNIRQEAVRTILAGGAPATATGGNVRRTSGRSSRSAQLPAKVEAPSFGAG